jgi:histidinol-phosphate phosphatase family protein
MTPTIDVVVPTIGRPSLADLLGALSAQTVPPGRVLVVDDRPAVSPLPDVEGHGGEGLDLVVVRSGGQGPAAARNCGWRAADGEWIAFLDDDVVPPADWFATLLTDLREVPPTVAASQGRIVVPRPAQRRPTDWERNVAGLERARWATADMAYRRSALAAVGGFDERFPRAYREDADLGLRVVRAGNSIEAGRRHVVHPVRPAGPWISVRLQRGNADDVLMRALHGRRWRTEAAAPPGRRKRHLAITASGLLALGAGAAALRPGGDAGRWGALAAAGTGGWLTGTTELAWARLMPGPRTRQEAVTVALTSAAIPAAATWHTLTGLARWGRLLCGGGVRPTASPVEPPAAVLFDRDGTLVRDVPYNGDPERVEPLPGARAALDRLRARGVRLAVISNQSGIARGRLTLAAVEAVNRRVEELLGPLGPCLICPHGPEDGCDCRKPAPGLVLRAAETLGVTPDRCAVVGDIGTDVEAARAAGARAILVPTTRTRRAEVRAAPEVAPHLSGAVDRLLGRP